MPDEEEPWGDYPEDSLQLTKAKPRRSRAGNRNAAEAADLREDTVRTVVATEPEAVD
jgi:hypothetical protein